MPAPGGFCFLSTFSFCSAELCLGWSNTSVRLTNVQGAAGNFPCAFGQIGGFCTVKQGNKTSMSCHSVMDEHIKAQAPG